MGRRFWMENAKVTIEVGGRLPGYEFQALREIIMKVALRVKREL